MGTDDQCAPMISISPVVPPVSVHQCLVSVLIMPTSAHQWHIISAHLSCLSVSPISAAYQCQSGPLISAIYKCCLLVPISDACQCPSVPPISVHHCSLISAHQ
ncbi:unnamed protein product [Staurois parvus]|uniref:Uncharacterized protein n=1 Tax=Staurois parvus TaxID=386267 RepID=A0ABN9HBH4_9NEOB|nr:unnamed protein product [Staurois parvus]